MTASRRRDELLRAQLTGFTRLLHRLERGESRSVHSTRVASRRLRELLPVLQLEPDALRPIKRDLRRVTRALGHVRELDVLTDLLDDLRTKSPNLERALASTIEGIKAARKNAHDRAFRKGLARNVKRVVRRIEKLIAAFEGDDLSEPHEWRQALEARVVRRSIRLQRAIVHAGGVFLPERLHEVRKSAKKLRYIVELSAQASRMPEGEIVRRLKKTQDVLGRLHDRQVGIDRIRGIQAGRAPDGDEPVGGLNVVLAQLEDDCRRLHGQYVRGRDDLVNVCDQLFKRSPVAVLRAKRSSRLAHAG